MEGVKKCPIHKKNLLLRTESKGSGKNKEFFYAWTCEKEGCSYIMVQRVTDERMIKFLKEADDGKQIRKNSNDI